METDFHKMARNMNMMRAYTTPPEDDWDIHNVRARLEYGDGRVYILAIADIFEDGKMHHSWVCQNGWEVAHLNGFGDVQDAMKSLENSFTEGELEWLTWDEEIRYWTPSKDNS